MCDVFHVAAATLVQRMRKPATRRTASVPKLLMHLHTGYGLWGPLVLEQRCTLPANCDHRFHPIAVVNCCVSICRVNTKTSFQENVVFHMQTAQYWQIMRENVRNVQLQEHTLTSATLLAHFSHTTDFTVITSLTWHPRIEPRKK